MIKAFTKKTEKYALAANQRTKFYGSCRSALKILVCVKLIKQLCERQLIVNIVKHLWEMLFVFEFREV